MNVNEGVIGRIDSSSVLHWPTLLGVTMLVAILAYVGISLGGLIGAPTPDLDPGIWMLALPVAALFGRADPTRTQRT